MIISSTKLKSSVPANWGADPDAIKALGIVVPVRNEETHLGQCLDAIETAKAHVCSSAFSTVTIRTVVVLDGCTDRSAIIASRHPEVEAVTADLGSVGAARALGAKILWPTPNGTERHLWLANTDADSTIPADWLTSMLTEAYRGADLILGTVQPDATATRQLREAWNNLHTAEDNHPHIHGANLGIRVSTYLDLGGWSTRMSGEDVSLVQAADIDPAVRILRTGSIPVVTSSRLVGRAPQGFANYLQCLTDDLGKPTLVTAARRR